MLTYLDAQVARAGLEGQDLRGNPLEAQSQAQISVNKSPESIQKAFHYFS